VIHNERNGLIAQTRARTGWESYKHASFRASFYFSRESLGTRLSDPCEGGNARQLKGAVISSEHI